MQYTHHDITTIPPLHIHVSLQTTQICSKAEKDWILFFWGTSFNNIPTYPYA